MGFIKETIEIQGIRKSKKLMALLDTGAFRNYLRREHAEEIGFHIYEGKHRVILADGSIGEGMRVRFKGLKIKDRFVEEPEIIIMDNLIEDAIIGVHIMQELGLIPI